MQGYSSDTFGEEEETYFRLAISNIVQTAPEFVYVSVDGQDRRHLLAMPSVNIKFVVTSTDIEAANSVQRSLVSISSVEMANKLKTAGLYDVRDIIVTVLQPVEVAVVEPTAIVNAYPEKPSQRGRFFAKASATVTNAVYYGLGSAGFVILAFAIVYYVKRKHVVPDVRKDVMDVEVEV
jgi:hypothetical protein